MPSSTSTDDGLPIRCEICGTTARVDVSQPPGDAVCPACGSFLWADAVSQVATRYGLIPDLRLPCIEAATCDDALRHMVDALAKSCVWSAVQAQDFQQAIDRREHWGSTAIGRGVAVPHAVRDWLQTARTAVAFASNGIDFGAPDGLPVQTIIMLASPSQDPAAHLRRLESISRTARAVYGRP